MYFMYNAREHCGLALYKSINYHYRYLSCVIITISIVTFVVIVLLKYNILEYKDTITYKSYYCTLILINLYVTFALWLIDIQFSR